MKKSVLVVVGLVLCSVFVSAGVWDWIFDKADVQLSPAWCRDADGANIFRKNSANSDVYIGGITDVCDGAQLKELQCFGDELLYKWYDCPYGSCVEGACPCYDSDGVNLEVKGSGMGRGEPNRIYDRCSIFIANGVDELQCVNGELLYVPYGCDSGQCVDGACVSQGSRACENVICSDWQVCNENTGQCQSCGGQSQSCCENGLCNSGLECNSETDLCQTCGAVNQLCCSGECNAGLECSSGNCVEKEPESCGDVSCSAGQICNSNTLDCQYCGGQSQLCCSDDGCNVGFICSEGLCDSCGSTGEVCCADNGCDVGNVCNSETGLCQGCGTQGQLCCEGDVCRSGLTCNSNSGLCQYCGNEDQLCCAGGLCAEGKCVDGLCVKSGEVIGSDGGSDTGLDGNSDDGGDVGDDLVGGDDSSGDSLSGGDSLIDCSGCVYESECVPIGFRGSGRYCDFSGNVELQKDAKLLCDNDFECLTNSCLEGECTEPGFWAKILSFMERFFG